MSPRLYLRRVREKRSREELEQRLAESEAERLQATQAVVGLLYRIAQLERDLAETKKCG